MNNLERITTESPSDPADGVFRLGSQAIMEEFDDEALLLRLEDLHILELNQTACHILNLSDGQRPATQVARVLAQTFQIPEEEALEDSLALYDQLSDQGIVEAVPPHDDDNEDRDKEKMAGASTRYSRNPDVVLREKDEDVILLDNSATDQVWILNSTGRLIWQLCDGSRNLNAIVDAVCVAFDDAPEEPIANDVLEFVEAMEEAGFLCACANLVGGSS